MPQAKTAELPDVSKLEVSAENIDIEKAAAIYKEHGCLVVRGLMKNYVDVMHRDIMQTVKIAISQLDNAVQSDVGWTTPNNCLFIPAPENYDRDKQIMTIGVDYHTSAGFLASTISSRAGYCRGHSGAKYRDLWDGAKFGQRAGRRSPKTSTSRCRIL